MRNVIKTLAGAADFEDLSEDDQQTLAGLTKEERDYLWDLVKVNEFKTLDKPGAKLVKIVQSARPDITTEANFTDESFSVKFQRNQFLWVLIEGFTRTGAFSGLPIAVSIRKGNDVEVEMFNEDEFNLFLCADLVDRTLVP